MKKVEYDQQPAKLEAVGNGSHLYRYAIEQVTRENPEGEETTAWKCYEVLVWNKPTRETVTEAVITSIWPSTAEAKLINDYNAAKEGILPVSYMQPYINFINERKAIKDEITAYFANESV